MTTIGIEILQAKTVTYRIRGELQREKNPQQNIEAIMEAITALEGVEPEIFVSNEGGRDSCNYIGGYKQI